MAAPAPDSAGRPAWDGAPCMLVTLDAADRVTAVNARFLERTGFPPDGVMGRVFWDECLSVGSRIFYQTQLAPVLQLDERLDEVMVDLRTVDGGRLPALMNVSRRRTGEGAAGATAIALMAVSDRRAFENTLRQARDDAEHAHRTAELARSEAEHARREAELARADTQRALEAEARARLRLELLARANTALASSLDLEIALHRLARVLTDRLADWCLIFAVDPDAPGTMRWSAAHRDPARQADIERLAALAPEHATLTATLRQVHEGGVPTLLAMVSDAERRDSTDSAEVRSIYSTVGVASVIVVPARARGRHVATIALGRGDERPPFVADDLADITDVGARTGLIIDNLRRQAREHSNSIALQHALLTTPPAGTGFDIATRYEPATNGNDVGGDWYDALVQPDGSLVLVIGDVVGHDIHAAAAMGQVRGIVRTLAYASSAGPAEILSRADVVARGLGVDVLASALVARLTTDGRGHRGLQLSNAGHPPPLLMTSSGVQVLRPRADRLLGLPAVLDRPRHDQSYVLQPGDTLALYTDGLVERVEEVIDDRIEALAAALPKAGESDLDELCETILRSGNGDTEDDVALIVVRVPTGGI